MIIVSWSSLFRDSGRTVDRKLNGCCCACRGYVGSGYNYRSRESFAGIVISACELDVRLAMASLQHVVKERTELVIINPDRCAPTPIVELICSAAYIFHPPWTRGKRCCAISVRHQEGAAVSRILSFHVLWLCLFEVPSLRPGKLLHTVEHQQIGHTFANCQEV